MDDCRRPRHEPMARHRRLGRRLSSRSGFARADFRVRPVTRLSTRDAEVRRRRDWLQRIRLRPRAGVSGHAALRDPMATVSVIMPAYNVERYVADAAHSAL